jgi:lipoyl(octanoyl) transferase
LTGFFFVADWSISHLGMMPYHDSHRLQLGLIEARRAGVLDVDIVLMLEHPPVFTMGRSCNRSNIIKDEKFLTAQRINTIAIERGGDVTFHGPGQLVVYLLIDLKARGMDIRSFVMSLEEVMIRSARDQGISATRDPRNIGVWVNGEKLGSIGIAIRHGITFHGFALNVNVDLTPFQWIYPCGLKDVSMTSLSILKKAEVNMADVYKSVEGHLQDVFHIGLKPVPSQWLEQFGSIHRIG